MTDETLKRRVEIIEAIYRHGMMPTWELAEHLDVPPEELTVDVAALVEQGALTHPGADGTCYVTDAALAAMDLGMSTTAKCVVSQGAMPITNLAAENARLKDLVRHVQSQPDGLRSCRIELTDKSFIITMPAGDEHIMAERIVQWLADKCARDPKTANRVAYLEQAVCGAGEIAWQFQDALKRANAASSIESARAIAGEALARLAKYDAALDECHDVASIRCAWSPHITLADCAAWAEAIVVALEAEGFTQDPYPDTLYLARAIERKDARTGPHSLTVVKRVALNEARNRRPWVARAYSAIIAVRMLAAEAVRREQT